MTRMLELPMKTVTSDLGHIKSATVTQQQPQPMREQSAQQSRVLLLLQQAVKCPDWLICRKAATVLLFVMFTTPS